MVLPICVLAKVSVLFELTLTDPAASAVRTLAPVIENGLPPPTLPNCEFITILPAEAAPLVSMPVPDALVASKKNVPLVPA